MISNKSHAELFISSDQFYIYVIILPSDFKYTKAYLNNSPIRTDD